MRLFSKIMSKIFGGPAEAVIAPVTLQASASVPSKSPAATPAPSPAATPTPREAAPASAGPPPEATAAAPPPPAPAVDVTALLDGLAAKNREKLDWRKSIVDLMKLLDMDSSLTARKELAAELDYPGDTGDSAKMNVWLHKEVIKKIAANGGNVPADLLD